MIALADPTFVIPIVTASAALLAAVLSMGDITAVERHTSAFSVSYQVNISAIAPGSIYGLPAWLFKPTSLQCLPLTRSRELDVHDYIKTILAALANELRRDACIAVQLGKGSLELRGKVSLCTVVSIIFFAIIALVLVVGHVGGRLSTRLSLVIYRRGSVIAKRPPPTPRRRRVFTRRRLVGRAYHVKAKLE